MQKIKLSTGFTLIELLVVMAIISILAGMSIFAMQGARESARDAARRGELETIATALEFYKADCHTYPPSLPNAGDKWEPTCLGETRLYLERMPGDPVGGNYAYNVLSPNRYTLCSTLEDPPDPANDILNCGSCAGGFSCEYKITNP